MRRIYSLTTRICPFFFLYLAVALTKTTEASKSYEPGHVICYPETADAQYPTPFPTNEGIEALWIGKTNNMKNRCTNNVTFYLTLKPAFYKWTVAAGVFDGKGLGFSKSSDPAAVQAWCETKNQNCLNGINAHLCQEQVVQPNCSLPTRPSQSVRGGTATSGATTKSAQSSKNALACTDACCGPWLPKRGTMSTYSDSQRGSASQGYWTIMVENIGQLGEMVLLVVFRAGSAMCAMRTLTTVTLLQVCGDNVCHKNETCETCEQDCGACFEEHDIKAILLWVSVAVISCFLLGILVICCLRRRMKKAFEGDNSWIIKLCDLGREAVVEDSCDGCMAHLSSASKTHSQNCAVRNWWSFMVPDRKVASDDLIPDEETGIHYLRSRNTSLGRCLFTPLAFVHGKPTAVKVYRNDNFLLTAQIRKEVSAVRRLDHPNVCRFVGGTVEPGLVYILTEYCPKGSLMDILQNDTIVLNWAFRFSMLKDITRGMAYLHLHGMVHGRLKTTNCVVDDRWTCKITDFGLREYRQDYYTRDMEDVEDSIDISGSRMHALPNAVYRAPEAVFQAPIAASDVYSFAMIMVEVATRDQIHLMIVKCWDDKPANRPTFRMAECTITRMNPIKRNAVDTMMDLMHSYSKNLEFLVEQRSKQLLEEKAKTDKLLYSILPRQVAESLKNGHQVIAESYECATVFFSDIVAFTDLSAKSSPMQVVYMLNKLYTMFDSIIERYQVYKVETVGDAYMVVSGVPERTEKHAFNVSLMSLEILSNCETFYIPHIPDRPLLIRIGVASGPVCAGVVGVKMPRYCLFGDTINTASRMESHSQSNRIHISDLTYKLLLKYNHFYFEEREKIEVKISISVHDFVAVTEGKGKMQTYWLVGISEESPLNSIKPSSVRIHEDSQSTHMEMPTFLGKS